MGVIAHMTWHPTSNDCWYAYLQNNFHTDVQVGRRFQKHSWSEIACAATEFKKFHRIVVVSQQSL